MPSKSRKKRTENKRRYLASIIQDSAIIESNLSDNETSCTPAKFPRRIKNLNIPAQNLSGPHGYIPNRSAGEDSLATPLRVFSGLTLDTPLRGSKLSAEENVSNSDIQSILESCSERSRGGRPKKRTGGPGRPRKSVTPNNSRQSTPIAILTDQSENLLPAEQNRPDFANLVVIPFPDGYDPAMENELIAAKTHMDSVVLPELWNTDAFLVDSYIHGFLCFLSQQFRHRQVCILSPVATHLDIAGFGRNEVGPTDQNFDFISHCFNYSPEYEVLIIPMHYAAHFVSILFDRRNNQGIFIDSLRCENFSDRLYDSRYPAYNAIRLQVVDRAICALTPGLSPQDYIISVANQNQMTLQTGGTHCGYFQLLYIESWLSNNENPFILPNLDIHVEKKRILWHCAKLFQSNDFAYFPPEFLINRHNSESVTANILNESCQFSFTDANENIQSSSQRNEQNAVPFSFFDDEESAAVQNMVNNEPISHLLSHPQSRDNSGIYSAPCTVSNSITVPSRRSERIRNRSPMVVQSQLPITNPQTRAYSNPITQRCHLRHKDYSCADVRAKHTPDYYDSGKIGAAICFYCRALLFESEVNKEYKTKSKIVTSSFCCRCGTVSLPPYSDHPQILKRLSRGDTIESKDFLKKENIYNSLLAFSSISVGQQESSLCGGVCFLLNGEFVRQMSSMFPGTNAPCFSQLYILDPANALEHRTQNCRYGGDRVDRNTLIKLDRLLREIHPFAKIYINFHEQYQRILAERGPDAVANFRLTLLEQRNVPQRIQDRSLHSRQVNLPNEGSLFAVWTEYDMPPQCKGIFITNAEGHLFVLPPYHPLTDTLCYPILFPCGDDSFHHQIPVINRQIGSQSTPLNDDEENNDIESVDEDQRSVDFSDSDSVCSENSIGGSVKKRKFITMRDYIRYRLAIRDGEDFHNIFSAGGGLSQKFVLDYSSRIDCETANFLRRPELNLRSTTSEDALRWLARNANLASPEEIGRIVMFRKYHPGTRPYFQDMFYDATTIMSRFRKAGYASFMFTFTSNPYWPEVQNNFFYKSQKLVDRFDIICRVYEDKLRLLHYYLDTKNIFGKIAAFGESREFQKRIGGPHLHRVFHSTILAVPENIDNLIWAHIPEEPARNDHSDWANFIRQVRKLLPKFQIHDCGEHCKNAQGRCKKGFPRPFSDFTILFDDKPAHYKRPHPLNGGQTLIIKKGNSTIIYDNSRIVPYNPFILVLFQTHHNLEYAYGQSDNLKYALKYPFKGPSFSYIRTQEQGRTDVDEPAFYAKMLYRSPTEAYSRIMSYKYALLSHTVIPLQIHLPGKQKIYIRPGQEEEMAARVQAGDLPETPLTSYWKQWRAEQEIKNILFENMPEKYSFNKTSKKWVKRRISTDPRSKRKPIIGRILTVSPREPEKFALYILMKHFPGDPDHLLTVNGHICDKFLESARLRGLIEDNAVWERTLNEGATALTPSQMRQLFASILIFGSTENCLIDGRHLWESFHIHMYDRRCSDIERPARIDMALALIERLLLAHGRQMSEFGLPEPTNSLADDPDRALDEFFFPMHINDDDIDETVDTSSFEGVQLNAEQQEFFNLIRDAIMADPNDNTVQRLFYLSGDGGVGKTFLLNFIAYEFRRGNRKVMTTASTGIASTRFYTGGMTVHSAFRFGINLEANQIPSIPFESFFGRRIIETELIIIDEVTMLHKILFENLDLLCRTMVPQRKNSPFANKIVIISGDWKQGLPVVTDANGVDILAAQVAACIQSSHLYPLFQKIRLMQNMRVIDPSEREFLQWLEEIGTGRIGNSVSIPNNMIVHTREELASSVFENSFNIPSEDLLKRLMLGITNRIVDANNSAILRTITSDEQHYYSVDKPLQESPLAVNAAEFDVTQLNLLSPLGLSAHHLHLKIDSIIVLLINMNTSKMLCNGTRLIIRQLMPDLIIAETIIGNRRSVNARAQRQNMGTIVAIPRMLMTHKASRPDGVSFTRFQFPVRIAFTMTSTKAQGQTCERLGIDFTDEPFAHGQLYSSLSRATGSQGIKIYAPNKPTDANGNTIIRNVVARDLQFD